MSAVSYSEAVLPVICDVHGGRALEYYCETDQVPICSQCALLGDHQGHEITTCDDRVGGFTSLYHSIAFSHFFHHILHFGGSVV